MKCATHPDVETNLRCNKCGTPICPRCLVYTPVGARCVECARLYRLPTFRVTGRYYLRAIGTALGLAIACGLLWGLIMGWLHLAYLNFLLASGTGYAVGEVVSLAVNRKRGNVLAIIAGTAVAISYLVNLFSPWGSAWALFHLPSLVIDLLALALGIFIAVTRLR